MKRFFLFVLIGLAATAWLRSHPCSMTVPAQAPVYLVSTCTVPPPPSPPTYPTLERVEGLPVPVFSGTRVTVAQIDQPRVIETRAIEPRMLPLGDSSQGLQVTKVTTNPKTIVGRLSADQLRAQADARKQLERQLTEWLVPEIPASWKAPASLIDQTVAHVRIKPVVKDYGTLYEAQLDLDWSPERRNTFLEAYQHDLVTHRMTVLGGLFAFILSCLAALTGYIRADEATKGYYTNGLRLAAAAGVGAAGVVLYQLLA